VLVEFMKMLDSSQADLARRWLSVLLAVPAAQRGALVRALESRFHTGMSSKKNSLISLRGPAMQRDGYIETIIRSFEKVESPAAKTSKARATRRASAS